MATLTTRQCFFEVPIVVTKLDGTPGAVDGLIVESSSDDTVINAVVSADGTKVTVNAVAVGGPARITLTGDADLGAGVNTITGVLEDVTVTLDPRDEPMATSISAPFSAPVDKVIA